MYGYKAENTEEVIDLLERIVTGDNTNLWYETAGNCFDCFDSDNCKRLADKALGLKDNLIL